MRPALTTDRISIFQQIRFFILHLHVSKCTFRFEPFISNPIADILIFQIRFVFFCMQSQTDQIVYFFRRLVCIQTIDVFQIFSHILQCFSILARLRPIKIAVICRRSAFVSDVYLYPTRSVFRNKNMELHLSLILISPKNRK